MYTHGFAKLSDLNASWRVDESGAPKLPYIGETVYEYSEFVESSNSELSIKSICTRKYILSKYSFGH